MLYVIVEELIPESQMGEHSNIGTIGFAHGPVYTVHDKAEAESLPKLRPTRPTALLPRPLRKALP